MSSRHRHQNHHVSQDLPVIMPTNVSVDESQELLELYGDDYDDLESIFNRFKSSSVIVVF